ncbi:MAG: hypothetical protein ACYTGG_10745, partial [Planctomycetota bacterium]
IELYRDLQPFGEFTAHLDYARPDAFGRGGFQASLQPTTLGLQLEETPILAEFEPGSEIEVRDGVISLHGLRARHSGGAVAVDGTIDTNGATDIDLDLSSEGPMRSDELWALLPQPVRTVLDGINYEDGASARLVNGHLRLTKDESLDGARRWRIGFDGRVETEGANLDVGLGIKDLDGAFEIALAREPGQVAQVSVLATARSMQAGRDFLTNVVAPIRFSPDGRSVLIPDFRADMYGGTLAANVNVGIHENKRYDMKIDIVGASLRDMYRQLNAPEEDEPGASEEPEPTGGPEGTIFANVSITGRRGVAGSRVGRGAVRIMDGKFAKVLFSLRVMQVLQLTLPLQHDYFDFAKLDFYLENDRVVFDEEILLESGFGDIASLQLIGKGWMDADTFELNTRFRIRTGMLVLRDLAGGLSDGLFLIELTGPIFEPNVNIIPLPGISNSQSPAAAARRPRTDTDEETDDPAAIIASGERPED